MADFYRVTISIEVAVLAEDEEHAEELLTDKAILQALGDGHHEVSTERLGLLRLGNLRDRVPVESTGTEKRTCGQIAKEMRGEASGV